MHPKTEALLEKLLVMLMEKGEDETFAYIKRMNKKTDKKTKSRQ